MAIPIHQITRAKRKAKINKGFNLVKKSRWVNIKVNDKLLWSPRLLKE